jgi:hypothetical protein
MVDNTIEYLLKQGTKHPLHFKTKSMKAQFIQGERYVITKNATNNPFYKVGDVAIADRSYHSFESYEYAQFKIVKNKILVTLNMEDVRLLNPNIDYRIKCLEEEIKLLKEECKSQSKFKLGDEVYVLLKVDNNDASFWLQGTIIEISSNYTTARYPIKVKILDQYVWPHKDHFKKHNPV